MIVRTVDDLARLRQWSAARRGIPRAHLTIAIAGLAGERRERAQRELNALAHACGCGTGGTTALVALGVAIVCLGSIVHTASWPRLFASAVGALAAVVASALVGKAIGLWIARVRFRRACNRLIAELATSRPSWQAAGARQ